MAVRIDENIDETLSNVDSAQTQLLKYLNTISSNRWLVMKIFGVLMVFMVRPWYPSLFRVPSQAESIVHGCDSNDRPTARCVPAGHIYRYCIKHNGCNPKQPC